jgi:hypothetical protein
MYTRKNKQNVPQMQFEQEKQLKGIFISLNIIKTFKFPLVGFV